MSKTGVNKYGVRWIKRGEDTYCFYLLTSGLEITRTFAKISSKALENITGVELLKLRGKKVREQR